MDAQLVVFADDLTGAAETAAKLGRGSTVLLWRGDMPQRELSDGPLVIDTATRALPADEAARVIGEVISHQVRSPRIMLKVDSLLRSHATEIGALRQGRTVVVCPALPALDRPVRGGRSFVGVKPLDQTDAWLLESRRPPASIAHWLHPMRVEHLSLADLRSGQARLREGGLHVCDAETDADVSLVAALAARTPDSLLAGSAAVVAAGASVLGAAGVIHYEPPSRRASDQSGRDRGLLLVVGTAAAEAREQLAEVSRAGVTVVPMTADVGDVELDHVRSGLSRDGTVALTWSGGLISHVDPVTLSHRLATRLAPLIRQSGADLFLTGGQTARTILDELAVDALTVVADVTHGVVISMSGDGRLIGTRPGSFGTSSALIDVASAIRAHRNQSLLHDPSYVGTERGSP